MNIWLLILLGISLSMDTFSLALSLGTFNISKNKIYLFSITVGIFHFIMPMLGFFLGQSLRRYIAIDASKLLFMIFFFIGIEMIIDYFNKEEKEYKLTIFNMILYAFSVSIDSFTLGIGLKNINLAPTIFMVISSLFTFMGLNIGKLSYKHLGNYSKLLGIVIIMVVAILHLFKG